MEWNDKVAIVTGGSAGIGKATKDLLRQKGAIVYNLDRDNPDEPDDCFILCEHRLPLVNWLKVLLLIMRLIISESIAFAPVL
jgi:NAD(P)-dependent dehydrogenase (short-subunit alcohol dehydrogenase family)